MEGAFVSHRTKRKKRKKKRNARRIMEQPVIFILYAALVPPSSEFLAVSNEIDFRSERSAI